MKLLHSNQIFEGKISELQVLNDQKMKINERQNLEIQKLSDEKNDIELKYSKISNLESDLKSKFKKIKSD